MERSSRTRMWVILAALLGASLAPRSHAHAVAAVAVVRGGGCGGRAPIAAPLHHSATLDELAAQWAQGAGLQQLAARGGYPAGAVSELQLSASGALAEKLSRSDCRVLASPALREIGAYERGPGVWLVLAASAAGPASQGTLVRRSPPAARLGSAAPTPGLGQRALELVNDARARGTRCGSRAFAPAPPLSLSGTLAGVALGHATDMAQHGYFEHQDLSGQSPAERVRAVGYREKLVGENIAYGPGNVDEVMRGWLDSPGHCENIMDPRFAQMGLALAAGHGSRHGLYWVQVLAAPRA